MDAVEFGCCIAAATIVVIALIVSMLKPVVASESTAFVGEVDAEVGDGASPPSPGEEERSSTLIGGG